MKRIIILLIIGCLLNGTSLIAQDYYEINFSFTHSRRIPYNYVNINIIKRQDIITIKVKSIPLDTISLKWKYSIIDTTFMLSKHELDILIQSLNKIKSSDIISKLDFIGFDGTSYAIEFGSFDNTVKYKVWSPDYNTIERNLQSFLETCKFFITTAKLNLNDIIK
jgi:hypothetical protein